MGFISCKTYAQELIHFTTNNGLPSNHVYHIQEDNDGFIWFATNKGVVKYDGDTFKTFTIQNGLPNNDTWKLDIDSQNRLWYFSKSKYQGYIYKDSIYKFMTENKEVVTPGTILKTDKHIWFTSHVGLYKFNDSLFSIKYNFTYDEYKKFLLFLNEKYNIPLDHIIQLIDPDRKLFAIVQKNKVLYFDWNSNFIEEIPHSFNFDFSKKYANSLGYFANGIGYYAIDKDVIFIDFKTKKIKVIPLAEDLEINDLQYIKIKHEANEIQISVPGHLLIYNEELELISKFQFPKNLPNIGSYKDSNGNIWLRNFSQGVYLLPSSQIHSKYYFTGEKIQSINTFNDDLYVGIHNKGVYKFQKNNQPEIVINDRNLANIYRIKKYNDQLVFILSKASYILQKNELKKIELYDSLNNYISGAKDYILLNDTNYLVTSDGIYRFSSKNKSKEDDLITYKQGLYVTETLQNKLFFGGSDGLHLLDHKTLVRPIPNEPLLEIPVLALTAAKNFLFVGTDGRGLFVYDGEKYQSIKQTDGLSIQKILNVNNNLWLATDKGIYKIKIDYDDVDNSSIVDRYFKSDGLLQNNTNDLIIKDSILYAASDIGLSKLNLNDRLYKTNPQIYFKLESDTLTFLPHERANINIAFSTLNFYNQEHISYEYRLLPQKKDWQTTVNKNLNFLNLKPSDYILELRATDQHNNSSIIKHYVEILPKWHERKIVRIGLILLVLLLFLLINKLIIRQIKKSEQKRIKRESRIADLELMALRSQMNPHFVHNSINAIQYFIQKNEMKLSEEYLTKFSKLIRLFFEYSRRKTVSIQEEIELLTYYLEIEKLRFENKLNYNIIVSNKIDTEEQVIPSMILQPIVENAVNHGIFHKKDIGNISINFEYIHQDSFKITIEDDGVGLIKAKEIFKKSSKNYQSNSSAVLKERLELLNFSKDWSIKYNIEDLSESDHSKSGTIVTLIFKQNYY